MVARRSAVVLLVALGVAGLAAAWRAPDPRRIFEDDRDYLAGAANLARQGTLSFESPDIEDARPGAYREPGYPALLALGWRVGGAPVPATREDLLAILERDGAWHPVRAVNLALLVTAAAACGWAAWRLGGELAGAAAWAAVAASPALHESGTVAMSENAGATLVALLAAGWTACLARPARGTLAFAVAVTAVAPVVRAETIVLLPVAIGWVLIAGSRRVRRPLAAAACLALVLPSLGWMSRNRIAVGHAVLSDRGGLALAVRAALDEEVARHGVVSAALAWTPSDAARAASGKRAPEATFLDHRPVGPGNFFTATLRRWQSERAAAGADPLAVDARYRDAALRQFLRRPIAHLAAMPAVAWRGLFAERSPGWARPLDLTLPLALLLAAGTVWFAVGAVRRRDVARLAFLAPLAALWLFHVAATELLPRYTVPLLPLAWTALVVTVSDRLGAPRAA